MLARWYARTPPSFLLWSRPADQLGELAEFPAGLVGRPTSPEKVSEVGWPTSLEVGRPTEPMQVDSGRPSSQQPSKSGKKRFLASGGSQLAEPLSNLSLISEKSAEG